MIRAGLESSILSTCGSNQVEGRKFCTTCGTSLNAGAQAASAQIPSAAYPPYPPYPMDPHAAERERQAAKGLRLTVTGGIFVAIYLFSFVLSLPMRGGDVPGLISFLGFIGLIMGATGAAKLVGARPPYATSVRQMPSPAPPASAHPQPPAALPNFAPQPIFSAPREAENAPPTGSLTPPPPSALEEATQHLPDYAPPLETKK